MSASLNWDDQEFLARLLDDVASFPLAELLAEVAAWEPEPYKIDADTD